MAPILILDNVRSAHNVGSILRTADGAGVKSVWLCGITPAPPSPEDSRPAYVQERNQKLLAKTALGAEESLEIHYVPETVEAIAAVKALGYTIIALEQATESQDVFAYAPTRPWALIVGHEVAGVQDDVIAACDAILEIPMHGVKESLNVSVAAGIALYQLIR